MTREPTTGPPPLVISRTEAARLCGVSISTIRRAVVTGHLRAKRTSVDGKYLFYVRDLQAWLDGLPDA